MAFNSARGEIKRWNGSGGGVTGGNYEHHGLQTDPDTLVHVRLEAIFPLSPEKNYSEECEMKVGDSIPLLTDDSIVVTRDSTQVPPTITLCNQFTEKYGGVPAEYCPQYHLPKKNGAHSLGAGGEEVVFDSKGFLGLTTVKITARKKIPE